MSGLIDRAVTGLDFDHPEPLLDQAKYLHHAGSPWFLALTALGVVFGDIGTSPLYAFQVALSGLGHPIPTAVEVTGIVSLILWALIAMVSLKYVVFILRADNDGEGRHPGAAVAGGGRQGRRRREAAAAGAARRDRRFAALWGRCHHARDFGAVGDGRPEAGGAVVRAFHPAGDDRDPGLSVHDPAPRHPQHRQAVRPCHGGVVRRDRYSRAVHIAMAPAILRAVNPAEAAHFLAADPKVAFVVIGAVFLALTGGEALYADMGHVGATAIRRAWFALVLPALLLNYFGQGALILADPSAADNPFYKLVPGWALIPMVGACDDGDDHRLAGAGIRRVLADAAGDADGPVSAGQDHADVIRRGRADLRAGRELAVDGRYTAHRGAVPLVGKPRRRPMASQCPAPC